MLREHEQPAQATGEPGAARAPRQAHLPFPQRLQWPPGPAKRGQSTSLATAASPPVSSSRRRGLGCGKPAWSQGKAELSQRGAEAGRGSPRCTAEFRVQLES